MTLQQTPRIIYGYEKYYPVPLSVCSAHTNIGWTCFSEALKNVAIQRAPTPQF